MKLNHRLLAVVCAAAAFGAYAEAPDGYYSALNGKNKAALKQAVKQVARKHTTVSYGDPTWSAFRTTDTHTVGGQLVWWDMYSDRNVAVSSGHPDMNIEHSVPNSWWGKTQNDAYKDLFHLNPSDKDANSRKSNYPLGLVATVKWTNGVTTVGKPQSGDCGGAPYVFEPADEYKGDFARTYFYMFTIYDDINWSVSQNDRNFMFDGSSYPTLRPWAYSMLLEWAKNDPVDEKERNRNEAIYKIQKNRNPFIDLPNLAEFIWGSRSDEAFSVDNAGTVDPGPGPGTDPDPDKSLFCNFDQSTSLDYYLAQGWSAVSVAGDYNCWQVKTFDGNNYAAASAYKSPAASAPFESWLISPAVDFSGENMPNCLTFRTQGAYRTDDCSLEVYLLDSPDPRTATVVRRLDAKICTPNERRADDDKTSPVYCDWLPSGNVHVAGIAGNGYIGFKYVSKDGGTNSNIATYCVDDVKVCYNSQLSGIVSAEADAAAPAVMSPAPGVIGIYPAEGTPGSAYVCDMSGRRIAVVALSGQAEVSVAPGIYIVAFSGGQQARKVVVR